MTPAAGCSPFVVANEALNNPGRLHMMLEENGYLFFRGLVPIEKLLRLRKDILELCHAAGWVDSSSNLMDGIWSGAGPFTENEPEYMAVYRHVLKMPSFLEVPEDKSLVQLVGRIIGTPVLVHRRKIGRITFPNNVAQTTAVHQDWHYIRGTPETYTLWIPVGDCPVELGGLAVLKGSSRHGFIEHRTFSEKKYAAWGLADDQLPKEGVEWHAGDFQLGDFLLFHSYTIHKALPNLASRRLRLSIDNRYQREGTEIEPGSMGTHYNL